MQALLKIIGAECTVINRQYRALEVHKSVEIELRSIAICILRSRMLPRSRCMRICSKYYSDLTLRVRRNEGMVEVLQIQGDGIWPKVASEST